MTLAGGTGLALHLGHRISEDFVDLYEILRGGLTLTECLEWLPEE